MTMVSTQWMQCAKLLWQVWDASWAAWADLCTLHALQKISSLRQHNLHGSRRQGHGSMQDELEQRRALLRRQVMLLLSHCSAALKRTHPGHLGNQRRFVNQPGVGAIHDGLRADGSERDSRLQMHLGIRSKTQSGQSTGLRKICIWMLKSFQHDKRILTEI